MFGQGPHFEHVLFLQHEVSLVMVVAAAALVAVIPNICLPSLKLSPRDR